ncbi:MAG: hypothetical protein WCJ99_09025 [Betaproteobacteria bacterium]
MATSLLQDVDDVKVRQFKGSGTRAIPKPCDRVVKAIDLNVHLNVFYAWLEAIS